MTDVWRSRELTTTKKLISWVSAYNSLCDRNKIYPFLFWMVTAEKKQNVYNNVKRRLL